MIYIADWHTYLLFLFFCFCLGHVIARLIVFFLGEDK